MPVMLPTMLVRNNINEMFNSWFHFALEFIWVFSDEQPEATAADQMEQVHHNENLEIV